MKDDEWIIKNIKNKNEKAIYELIDKYGNLLKAIIKRHSYGYTSYHEECFNDVLLGVWENINQFDSEKGSFKNWLGAISRYQALNTVRNHKKEMESLELEDNKIIDLKARPADELIIKEDLDDFLSSLSNLDREIFIYLFYQGLTVKEISEIYSLSTDSIYKRVSRARENFREKKGEVR